MRITAEAFVLSDETREAVAALQDDVRMRRSEVSIHPGGLEEAAGILARMDSPLLLILESDKKGEALLTELDTVADYVAPETRVVVIGQDNDIGLYRQLVGMGVADYLLAPITPDDLIDTVIRVTTDESEMHLAPLVAVMGVRGGVGSSSLACNLAYKLGRDTGGEVVLVDLDISAGTAAVNLNLSPRLSAADVLAQSEQMDSMALDRFLQRYDDHLMLLGSTAQLDISFRPPSDVLERLLNQLRREFDTVVLDLPRQWSIWVRDVLLDASTVVVVAYPDLSNLRDAQKMLAFLREKRRMSLPTVLALNKVGMAAKAELSAKDFEEVVGRAPAAALPFEPAAFGQALNNGEPVIKKGASKAFQRSMDQLVAGLHLDDAGGVVTKKAPRRAAKSGLLGGLLGKKKKIAR
ncbi:AAA family ATPase [Roseospira navarrensis]|uniref:AAA family ATPase n=1 Tax=Roseospira navarrensis TaxID=140058 RepID=A0A7X1ZF08_9PROT|nr:AAA family ATPase [Roseospira navarrensis]MQX36030.1 AAA family ATPase [Roseospira navarrensis]